MEIQINRRPLRAVAMLVSSAEIQQVGNLKEACTKAKNITIDHSRDVEDGNFLT